MKFAINWTLTSQVLSPFTVDHALYARDALAKAIYGHTFTWLVNKINVSMENKVRRGMADRSPSSASEPMNEGFSSSPRSLQDSSQKTVIGLLDIYGFEVFCVNR